MAGAMASATPSGLRLALRPRLAGMGHEGGKAVAAKSRVAAEASATASPGQPGDGAVSGGGAQSPDSKAELAFKLRRLQNWFFLGLMYGFFYMSRYNFSAVQAAVAEQFGWSYSDYGSIISAGLLTYGCAVFFNGPLADRIGGKRAILIGAAGAAVFNVLFGLCHLFLLRPAVLDGGQVAVPAQLASGMSSSTVIAMFAALWACNHYFQSFGALSIVKINAAWFRVSERGQVRRHLRDHDPGRAHPGVHPAADHPQVLSLAVRLLDPRRVPGRDVVRLPEPGREHPGQRRLRRARHRRRDARKSRTPMRPSGLSCARCSPGARRGSSPWRRCASAWSATRSTTGTRATSASCSACRRRTYRPSAPTSSRRWRCRWRRSSAGCAPATPRTACSARAGRR